MRLHAFVRVLVCVVQLHASWCMHLVCFNDVHCPPLRCLSSNCSILSCPRQTCSSPATLSHQNPLLFLCNHCSKLALLDRRVVSAVCSAVQLLLFVFALTCCSRFLNASAQLVGCAQCLFSCLSFTHSVCACQDSCDVYASGPCLNRSHAPVLH